MQARKRLLGFVEMLHQSLSPADGIAARADGADIESGAVQRFQQGQVVEFGVVAEGDDAGARVRAQGAHGIIRHFPGDPYIRHGPGTQVFEARIADRHREVVEQRHGGQVFGERAGTDEQHPVLRAQGAGQPGAVEPQRLGRRGRRQSHRAGDAIDRALHQLPRLQPLHQRLQRREIRLEFQQQFQGAAAGQAEAVRLIRRDAVAHQRGCGLRHGAVPISAGVAMHQVVLDATSGDGTHAAAILAQRHHGADGPRR